MRNSCETVLHEDDGSYLEWVMDPIDGTLITFRERTKFSYNKQIDIPNTQDDLDFLNEFHDDTDLL